MLAAMRGHNKVVENLLKRPEIRVNDESPKTSTALHVASFFGHAQVVGELLNMEEIDVNKKILPLNKHKNWGLKNINLNEKKI